MVDQWSLSSRSVSPEVSDDQGWDVSQTPQSQPDQSQPDQNQPEVTRFYVREHQRTLPSGRVITVRRHSRTRGSHGRAVTPIRMIHPKVAEKGKGKGQGKSGKGKRITSQVSSGDEQ
eukprot:4528434-Amphidinium_carterae.1